MKSRVILAIIFSAILIGGASFYRVLAQRSDTSSALVAVKNPDSNLFMMDESLQDLGDSPQNTELSRTDALSRELFADYINLKSEDKVTSQNVEKLAEV